MSTTNINPYSGLKQIISGSYHVPRFEIVELARRYKLKPLEIGAYIMFYTSADWDDDIYRNGYIRTDFKQLAKVWNVPLSTLNDNLKRLILKGVIVRGDKGIPKIINFEKFSYSGSAQTAKIKRSNEFVESYFGNLDFKNEIPSTPKPKVAIPFKNTFKERFNDESINNNVVNVVSNPPKKSIVKSDEEYQKLFDENPNLPNPEDMKWIDKESERLGLIWQNNMNIITLFIGLLGEN